MLKKIICMGAILLLTGFSCLRVQADTAEGEIFCWLQWGEETVSEGSLEINKVGEPVPEGYRLGPEFGGGIIAGEDIPSQAFAEWMAEKVGPGLQQSPIRSGLIKFSGLEPGIYLIRQGQESEHFIPISPYLACVSEELIQVDTYPDIRPRAPLPATAQSPSLYLGALGITIGLSGLLLCIRDKVKENA